MARYEITSPEGIRYEITAPDDADEGQVMQYAQGQFAPKPVKDTWGDDFVGDLARQTTKRALGAAQLGRVISSPVTGVINSLLPDGVQKTLEEKEKKFRDAEDKVIDTIRMGDEERGLSALPAAFFDPLNAIPFGAIDKASIPARAMQAAGKGGVFGAVSGLMEPQKQGESRLDDIAKQGGFGVVFGGISQPALDAASVTGRTALNKLFKPSTQAIDELESAGMEPSMQAVAESNWISKTANVLENIPFVGKSFRETAKGYDKVAKESLEAAGMKGVVQPEDAGRAIEQGLRKAYESADVDEIARWEALKQSFPDTSLVKADATAQVINNIGEIVPASRGLTDEQIAAKSNSPILGEARKAFSQKTEQGAIASPYTTYGALDQARRDVFAKAKDLGVTQPGTATDATADAAKLYGAFKSDVRNQMQKSGVDTGLLDEADKATQVRSGVAEKIENYFGGIRKKLSPSGQSSFEITKANEKTPEAAFGKVVGSLKKGGTELTELRNVLSPDENKELTDGLFRAFAKDGDGISKIEWAKAYNDMSDEARLAFLGSPKDYGTQLKKVAFDDLASAINRVQNIQGFDKAKSAGRLITTTAIGAPTGLLSLLFGVSLGTGALPAVAAGFTGSVASGKAISKIMNDPNTVKAIAYNTRLMPTKFNAAKRTAMKYLYDAVANSPELSKEEKAVILNEGQSNEINSNPPSPAPANPPPVNQPFEPAPLPETQEGNNYSPQFKSAIQTVFKNEGEHTTEGTPTMMGIDSEVWPKEYKELMALPESERPAYAEKFYNDNFWEKYDIGSMPEDVQELALDTVVNHGGNSTFSRKLLRLAKRGISKERLIKMREAEYRRIAKTNPEKRKYLKGWANRAASFKEYDVAKR